jgi:hypothetical protein
MTDLATKILEQVAASPLVASGEDLRDYVYLPLVPATASSVDQGYVFPAVQSQGAIGICTGETITTMCESILNLKYPYVKGETELSRRFNYYWSRSLDGSTSDNGATPRSMCRAARNYGLPKESSWPFGTNINEVPTEEVLAEAAARKLSRYFVIPHSARPPSDVVADIESAIASGARVCVAYNVRMWMSFTYGPLGSKSHTVPELPDPALMAKIGGHILPLRGYDRSLFNGAGAFIGHNSWGTGWGDGGLWSMPYSLFSDPEFLLEIRVIDGFADVQIPYSSPEPQVEPTPSPVQDKKQDNGIGVGLTIIMVLIAALIMYSVK